MNGGESERGERARTGLAWQAAKLPYLCVVGDDVDDVSLNEERREEMGVPIWTFEEEEEESSLL